MSATARGGDGGLTFQWVLIAGPMQTLIDPATSDATVVGVKAGTSVYQVVVTDHLGAIAKDEAVVTVTRKDPRRCDFTPMGLIADRWLYLDGADGPLGCAIGPETSVQGTTARSTPFEHGEIVYTPDRGLKMLIAAYQQDDNIIVNWGDTAPNTYEKFLLRLDRDGANVGQIEVNGYVDRTNGFYRIHTEPATEDGAPEWFLPPADYAIIVEGCNGSDCDDWTQPAHVHYTIPPIPTYSDKCAIAPGMMPYGLIGDRWARLGGGDGPLGCPVDAEHTRPDTAVREQQFKNGQIIFDPAHGESMTLAAFLVRNPDPAVGDVIEAVWGNTAPYAYEKFIVRLDHQNEAGWYNAWQDDLGSGRSGTWAKRITLSGPYAVIVEGYGCAELLSPDPCNETFTAPAFVHYSGPEPAPLPDCPAAPRPFGLIGQRWEKISTAGHRIGCPVGPEGPMPGSATARVQEFDNGEIVYSPDQGPDMLLSAYQAGESIVVEWGNTPDEHERFVVHVDYEGRHIVQAEIDQPGVSGTYVIPVFRPDEEKLTPNLASGAGRYNITVEGCNSACATVTARASVNYRRIGDIDFSDISPPRTAGDALRDKRQRALHAARAVADAPIEGAFGDGEVTTALAKLYLVDETPDSVPRATGARFDMKTEVNNALRFQKIWSKSGTTISFNFFGCGPRSGDYDMVMKGYIPMLYRFRHLLAPDVRYRVLRLINKHGPFDPEDAYYTCVANVTETENHRWMIESTRYLMNQFMVKALSDAKFNNASNGMDALVLNMLQGVLKYDFREYNSRPYQRLSWAAIQNLQDYAENPKVRTAARMVLDYLSTKVAASSNDSRRNPPFRRVARYGQADLFNGRSDPIKSRFLLYTAPTPVMKELSLPDHVPGAAGPEMVLAAATYYEPPSLLLDVMLAHRPVFQRFGHVGAEVYASTHDFLVSGGGIPTDYAYGSGFSIFAKEEDLGVVEPTVLMPTGQFTTIEQMIHFGPTSTTIGFRAWKPGLCVAPAGFACGDKLFIPPYYLSDGRRQCWYRPTGDPQWTFIDSASPGCTANQDFGFYAAVYGNQGGFGFLEAVEKSRVTGTPLSLFAAITLARNRTRPYGSGVNTYTAWAGNDIRFNPRADNPIISTGRHDLDSNNPAVPYWPLAQGDLANSEGHSGFVSILNSATGETLVLDFRDPMSPKRIPAY